MGKLGRPKGLVAFETLKNLSASEAATAGMAPGPQRQEAGMAARALPRFIRPRTVMYAAALAVVALAMLGAFLLRSTLDVTVLRDRAPLFVRLSDGGIRNGYTIKIVNKRREDTPLLLDLRAPAGFPWSCRTSRMMRRAARCWRAARMVSRNTASSSPSRAASAWPRRRRSPSA